MRRQAPLNPPSPEAKKELVALPIDLASGNRLGDRRQQQGFTEYFRVRDGQIDDTQYNMVSEGEVATPDVGYAGGGYYGDGGRAYYPGGYYQGRTYYGGGGGLGSFFGLFGAPSYQQQRPMYPPTAQPNYGGQFGELRSRSSEDRRFVAPRRVDPDYPYRGQRW